MFNASLPLIGTAAAWRDAARRGLSNRIHPDEIMWHCDEPPTDPAAPPLPERTERRLRIPRDRLDLVDTAIWHRAPSRFDLAYRLFWHSGTGSKGLHGDPLPEMAELEGMRDAVAKCRNRLKRDLRFHAITVPGSRTIYAAACDPTHPTLEPIIPHFAQRLQDLHWLIVTPAIAAFGRDGTVAVCARAALPGWAARAAAELEHRAATTRPRPDPPQPPESLFPAPLPLQSRPDRSRRRNGEDRSRVLHESGLGERPAAE